MSSRFVEYFEHAFGIFTLSKQGNRWNLTNGLYPLSPLETEILVRLIEERDVVNVNDAAGSRSDNPAKIIQHIRKALGSNYVKADSRCEYIRTAHGDGYEWVYHGTKSSGHGYFELHPIQTNSQQLDSEMSFLSAAITAKARNEMNLTAVAPEDDTVTVCSAIKGNCLYFKGQYQLLLTISSKHRAEDRSVNLKSDDLFELLDSAKDMAVAALKELIPETIR